VGNRAVLYLDVNEDVATVPLTEVQFEIRPPILLPNDREDLSSDLTLPVSRGQILQKPLEAITLDNRIVVKLRLQPAHDDALRKSRTIGMIEHRRKYLCQPILVFVPPRPPRMARDAAQEACCHRTTIPEKNSRSE
jgi:hypothetical protein